MPRLSLPLHYDFSAPTKIVFGWGRRSALGELARTLGEQVWIVWGSRTIRDSAVGKQLIDSLTTAGLSPQTLTSISAEPTVAMVDEAAASLRSAKTVGSVIVAIGGGSAIDLAKGVAVTALLEPAVSVQEFLEGVGTRSVEFALPILAMPTTGGTGSEVTKNGVITCTDPVAKKSLRGECLFPRIALVDPQLCESLPRGLTAQSGMDALTQLIESYISCRATPIARAIALQGIPELFAALQEVATGQISRGTREALAHGALLSGMALANAGLGMAHGVAAALGALHKTSHGLACAMLLPVTVRANRRVCTEAYAEIATAMVAKANGANALADEFVLRIDTLAQDLGIPRRLSEINIIASDLPAIVAASQGNSLRGNPWTISPAELLAILREML